MSEEIWVAKIIKLKESDSWDKVLLDFVKPIIKTAENEKLLDTFHFLFEPELHLRIRLRKPEMVNCVEDIISQNAEKVKDLAEIKPTTYSGEPNKYGKEGWICAQKFFEIGSRFYLLKLETISKYLAGTDSKKREGILESCRIDQKGDFNESKLIHCFLNQTGHNRVEEALFHNQRTVESLLIYIQILYKNIDERLKKVEEQLKNK